MCSNVEVFHQMGAGHTHLAEWGGKGRWLMHSGNLGETSTYTSEQASAFLIHSYVASYVLTGWECAGCYPVQWHCSKV